MLDRGPQDRSNLYSLIAGTTPGPLILGSIMDSACKVWQDICGSQGNCWIYEKTDMGIKLFIWWIIVKVLSLTFNSVAQYLYKPPTDDDNDENDPKKSLDTNFVSATSEERKALTEFKEDVDQESVI